MPVHRCLIVDLEDTVAKIERSNEDVVAVAMVSDLAAVIVTRRGPGRPPKETR